MQNREFEKDVQQKMEELQLSPADTLWDKIEAELPEKKPRRRIFIILFFVLLLTSSGIILFLKDGKEKNIASNTTTTPGVVLNKDTLTKNSSENKTGGSITTSNSDDAVTAATTLPKNQQALTEKNRQFNSSVTSKSNSPQANVIYNPDSEDKTAVSIKRVSRYASKTKIIIKAPAIRDDAEEETTATEDYMLTALSNRPVSIELKKINPLQNELLKKSSSIPPDVDSALAVNRIQKPDNKKGIRKPWAYGIMIAAGTSGVISKNSGQNFLYNNNSSTSGGIGAQIPPSQVSSLNNPHAKNTYEIGFWANRPLNAQWRLATGFHYTRQSNYLMVGKKIDSAVSVSFDMNKSIDANSYYQPGGSSKYVNKYDLLQVPIMMQFKPVKRLPLYAETGLTAGVLLNSNALVYNYASKTYVTSPQLFNKIILSVNAGVTADVNLKNVIPFSVGFNVKYGISSVTKTSYGNQHFTNTSLYLKIPFKK